VFPELSDRVRGRKKEESIIYRAWQMGSLENSPPETRCHHDPTGPESKYSRSKDHSRR
jgi:hypothetical protein